jgi:hypothetical protein
MDVENEQFSNPMSMAALDRITVLAAHRLLAGQLPDVFTPSTVDRFPLEPPEGSVLRYTKTFGASERQYTYVALRAGHQWYVTGKRATPMTFGELVEDIGDNPCDIATTWAVCPVPEHSPFEDMTPAEWHAAMWPQAATLEEDQAAED